ncbi:4582_t:CDS:1 [Paraglomus occultum]|uniref:4582_t:CDS:1 n=1 Tax=Paraglomus occultum TaxID=144539 RepID=A0A9N8W8G1_9GLOM|nr:4582_t:CDS:1 [Paraglomus occultum]
MAWNTSHPPHTDRYCDFEECTNSREVGCILSCGHAYHYEWFLLQLESQCRYCAAYLMSGIEKNCRIFQQTVSSFNEMLIGENTDELAVEADDSNTGDEDFSLDDDNRDLLFVRALNTLTNV